jgi:hypothetical protein
MSISLHIYLSQLWHHTCCYVIIIRFSLTLSRSFLSLNLVGVSIVSIFFLHFTYPSHLMLVDVTKYSMFIHTFLPIEGFSCCGYN